MVDVQCDEDEQMQDRGKAVEDSRLGEATVMKHEGRVFLDITENGAVLTDIILQERRNFEPGRDYKLFFDEEDGQGVIICGDGSSKDATIFVEDIFEKEAYENSAGEIFIGPKDRSSRPATLEMHLRVMRSGEVKFRLAELKVEATLSVVALRRPRDCGMRVYWGLFQLYKLLGMTGFSKQASKWVWDCMPRWRKHIGAMINGDHFILSKHALHKDEKQDACPFSKRMLEEPAISTMGFCVLLSKWAHCTPQRGGLRDPAPRNASASLLRSVLGQGCVRAHGSKVRVVIDDKWMCRWPRPEGVDDTMDSFEVSFSRDGIVDLSPMVADDSKVKNCKLGAKWLHSIFLYSEDFASKSLSIEVLLRRVMAEPSALALAAQLLWFLARQAELTMSDVSQGRQIAADGEGVKLVEKGIKAGRPETDAQLFAYVSSCVRASEGHRVIGIATDKASPCSGSFVNTVVTLSSNELLVCCPQVVIVLPSTVLQFRGHRRLAFFGKGGASELGAV